MFIEKCFGKIFQTYTGDFYLGNCLGSNKGCILCTTCTSALNFIFN